MTIPAHEGPLPMFTETGPSHPLWPNMEPPPWHDPEGNPWPPPVAGIRDIDAAAINAAVAEWKEVGVKVSQILDAVLKLLPGWMSGIPVFTKIETKETQ